MALTKAHPNANVPTQALMSFGMTIGPAWRTSGSVGPSCPAHDRMVMKGSPTGDRVGLSKQPAPGGSSHVVRRIGPVAPEARCARARRGRANSRGPGRSPRRGRPANSRRQGPAPRPGGQRGHRVHDRVALRPRHPRALRLGGGHRRSRDSWAAPASSARRRPAAPATATAPSRSRPRRDRSRSRCPRSATA